MSTQWHIGCSGFHYPEWKEAFYPKGLPQRRWFEYYCEQFNTLELNVTFYRFPTAAMLQSWYSRSPAGFRFAVKAPRLITHYKQFRDTQRELADFYAAIREGLADKLGPVLFQLPRQVTYDEATLQRITAQLDPAFTNVIEFRHPTWWTPEVYTQLHSHRTVFCGISHPDLPDQAIVQPPTTYYRFHGVPRLYHSPYSEDFIRKIISAIRQAPGIREAWLYFNNTASLSAIDNARYARQLAEQIAV